MQICWKSLIVQGNYIKFVFYRYKVCEELKVKIIINL